MLYGMWLCTGVFIIVATILRCVICLGDKTQINLGTIWSIRETVSRGPSSPFQPSLALLGEPDN